MSDLQLSLITTTESLKLWDNAITEAISTLEGSSKAAVMAASQLIIFACECISDINLTKQTFGKEWDAHKCRKGTSVYRQPMLFAASKSCLINTAMLKKSLASAYSQYSRIAEHIQHDVENGSITADTLCNTLISTKGGLRGYYNLLPSVSPENRGRPPLYMLHHLYVKSLQCIDSIYEAKIGRTCDPKDREQSISTPRSVFKLMASGTKNEMVILERAVQSELAAYHIQHALHTEYFEVTDMNIIYKAIEKVLSMTMAEQEASIKALKPIIVGYKYG